jgi:beta-glucanase (GH16 family)
MIEKLKPSISRHVGQPGCAEGSGWCDRLELKRVGLLLIFTGLFVSAVRGGDLNHIGWETLSSAEKDHLFVVAKGQGNKRIERLDAQGGQKIRLVGFGLMSLGQLRSELRTDGADVLLDLGDQQQLRIIGASYDVISSIQIQLDRAELIPTFADEFDTLSLDLENGGGQPSGTWRTNFGYGGVHSRTLVNNGELEVYVDRLFSGTGTTSLNLDPFRIVDGKLEIVAEPLKEDLRQFTWGRSYSSGLLTSKGSFSQKYGVFEIRAKMPRGKGLWPAFWLLPVNKGWPPELDVLEILADNPEKLYVSWHSNAGGTHSSETKAVDVPDTSVGFHTYSVYWTRDTIAWFFDDIEIASKPTPQDFHEPMYMLVNLAVGGGWPGAPDTTTQFPAKYTIDWIRAYALKGAK